MKKFVSLALALLMVLSLSVNALAGEYNIDNDADPEGSTSQDITISVAAKDMSEKIYYVTVMWDSLQFAYDHGEQGTWNPNQHNYGGSVPGDWTKKRLNFTVYNHSNDAIVYTATTEDPADDGVTVSLGGEYNGITLENAATAEGSLGTPSKAPNNSFYLQAADTTLTANDGAKVATLTVSFVKAP